MGMSKYVCYCWPPIRNCKGRNSVNGVGNFDREHWSEIRTNLNQYLEEAICVPGAAVEERVHERFDDALREYIGSLQGIRSAENANVAVLRPLLGRLHASNAAILAYAPEILSEPESIASGLVAGSLPAVTDDDEVLGMAGLLASSARRAAHELIESIRLDNTAYMFHHQAVIYDIAQEMTRLASEACAIGSEDYLDTMHPHAVSVKRRHGAEMNETEPQRNHLAG